MYMIILHIYVCIPHVCLVPMEARRGHGILWNKIACNSTFGNFIGFFFLPTTLLYPNPFQPHNTRLRKKVRGEGGMSISLDYYLLVKAI